MTAHAQAVEKARMDVLACIEHDYYDMRRRCGPEEIVSTLIAAVRAEERVRCVADLTQHAEADRDAIVWLNNKIRRTTGGIRSKAILKHIRARLTTGAPTDDY